MRISGFVETSLPPGLLRLRALTGLGDADLALLSACLARTGRIHAARREIRGSGSRLFRPLLIVEGWAFRFRLLSDGRRQILGFCLPGDVIAMRSHLVSVSLGSITRLRFCELPARAGAFAQVLEISRMLDEAYLINQVVRLGRQTAYERIAHLMLELHERLEQAGLAGEARFPMPLTQEQLADALGLTSVHVNRTLQALRRDGMLVLEAGMARIEEPAHLAVLVDYAPARL